MSVEQVMVSIAQVALGGGIVQAILALSRRRHDLRQLDREADSVAVETADRLVVMLRDELHAEKEEARRDREDYNRQVAELKAERTNLQQQVLFLAEKVAAMQAELAIANSKIASLQKEGGTA